MNLNNIPLQRLLGALVLFGVGVAMFVPLGVSSYTMEHSVAQQAIEKQTLSVIGAAALASRDIAGLSYETTSDGAVSRIVAEALPPFAEHTLVDEISAMYGGVATVFGYDQGSDDFVRLSTSIKKEDGSRAIGTMLGKDSAAYGAVRRGERFLGEATILGQPYYTAYQPIVSSGGKLVGLLFTGVTKESITEIGDRLLRDIIVVVVCAFAFLAPAILLMVRRIVAAIPALARIMDELAAEKYDVSIPFIDARNEFGGMARSIQVFRDSGLERNRLSAEQRASTEARLQRQSDTDRAIAVFQKDMGTVLAKVSSTMSEMMASARRLNDISRQTADGATSAANASADAAGNVSTVASAAEELTSSIHEISAQVSRVKTVVVETTEATGDANRRVGSLAEAAAKIGEVVTLIQAIAEQTNLLALNATIEAARAGDAGRGFAVVAQEVKSLAAQTARATEDIGRQISGIQSSTNDAVTAIGAIATRMEEVNRFTIAMAAAVEEQGAATGEISRNAARASDGSMVVNENIAAVSNAASETISTATNVAAASKAVVEETDRLSAGIDRFLKEVAAA
ncbi:methyl-accepting chemotaxis protein [Chthonobacter albigriseus]|uniref:methyl-accepting chemotaxis protein n=1 Tax=Chthonobacter albigriseus TaxID=1683161 RepID=UPI0015EF9D9A|nr:Cache 3/Cache 2 fusion domain-containing protein [Chthonobacter albigriseus]